ncbi:MAG: DUF438 domain-containing protein [Sulfolobales archaeon]
MSTNKQDEKIKLVKDLLKSLKEVGDVAELKKKFKDVIASVSPSEIVAIEQQLVREGVAITDILKLCDLHVELFKEYLQPRVLEGVPEGHPLDLLMRENIYILKVSESLSLYASTLKMVEDVEQMRKYLDGLVGMLRELRNVRLHYRKIQMLIFPYLERRGITTVPRVLWGREDRALTMLRQTLELVERLGSSESLDVGRVGEVATKAVELAKEFSELVFRENKILFPVTWALFSEGEWVAISEIADEIGWLVDVGERRWRPNAKPVLPYELEVRISDSDIGKLPPEFRTTALAGGLEPDTYKIASEGDLNLGTGFLSPEEVKAVFRSLPLEITYANLDDRVKFFSESSIFKGFVRTKTIIGRKVEYCHPPRLEAFVMQNVKSVKNGEAPYKEYWTRIGGKIVRVLIAPVKGEDGKLLGVLEVVEDMTEIINKAEEIKKKIVVL